MKTCIQKCFITAEGNKLVAEGDKSAHALFLSPGRQISGDLLNRFDDSEVDLFFVDSEDYTPPASKDSVVGNAEGTKPLVTVSRQNQVDPERDKGKAPPAGI